jgi:hypothetical protein
MPELDLSLDAGDCEDATYLGNLKDRLGAAPRHEAGAAAGSTEGCC